MLLGFWTHLFFYLRNLFDRLESDIEPEHCSQVNFGSEKCCETKDWDGSKKEFEWRFSFHCKGLIDSDKNILP